MNPTFRYQYYEQEEQQQQSATNANTNNITVNNASVSSTTAPCLFDVSPTMNTRRTKGINPSSSSNFFTHMNLEDIHQDSRNRRGSGLRCFTFPPSLTNLKSQLDSASTTASNSTGTAALSATLATTITPNSNSSSSRSSRSNSFGSMKGATTSFFSLTPATALASSSGAGGNRNSHSPTRPKRYKESSPQEQESHQRRPCKQQRSISPTPRNRNRNRISSRKQQPCFSSYTSSTFSTSSSCSASVYGHDDYLWESNDTVHNHSRKTSGSSSSPISPSPSFASCSSITSSKQVPSTMLSRVVASLSLLQAPLWTDQFAHDVTACIKDVVDVMVQDGTLPQLQSQQHTFWSDLTPQDIIRSSSSQDNTDDVLGSGAFSNVTRVSINKIKSSTSKRGKQQTQTQYFALKSLRRDMLPEILTEDSLRNGSAVCFIKAGQELAREAYLLSRFDHEHIVSIKGWTNGGVSSYEQYKRHDAFFLVLELLQEETLDERVDRWNYEDINNYNKTNAIATKKHQHQRTIEQLTICRQVANALEYIHSKNVVYRDLKPQNIGFASIEDGQENKSINVKLMDFGLARELPSSGTTIYPTMDEEKEQDQQVLPYNNNSKNNMLFNMTGTVGTMRYMSPEICLNKPYGLEADIYSWSIVSYGILTQTRPYNDMTPDLYHTLVCQQGVRPLQLQSQGQELLSYEYRLLLANAWRTDPFKRLPLSRIQRQLDLFIQKEQLFLEAQELLECMPLDLNYGIEDDDSQASLNNMNMIMLSQSFSHDNMLNRLLSSHNQNNQDKQQRRVSSCKRRYYEAADDTNSNNSNNSYYTIG